MLGSSLEAMWLLLAFLIACGLLGIYVERRRLKNRRRRFSGREALTPEAIFDLYYVSSGLGFAAVSKVWGDVANIMKVDPGLMRPDDRFDKELGPEKGFPMEDERADLDAHIRRTAAKIGIPIDGMQLLTVDDVVRFLSTKS